MPEIHTDLTFDSAKTAAAEIATEIYAAAGLSS